MGAMIYLSNVVNVVNKANTTVAKTAIRMSSLVTRGFACTIVLDVGVAEGLVLMPSTIAGVTTEFSALIPSAPATCAVAS